MKKVYVVVDQDLEIIGVATDLNSITQVVEEDFLEGDEDIIDLYTEEIDLGYLVTVVGEELTYEYICYYTPVTGGVDSERI